MKKFTHDIIIIGGGAAGLTATAGCAQLGLKTALIEKAALVDKTAQGERTRVRLGGDCLYHGCVPSKTLLKSATVFQQARDFKRYGLPPVELHNPDMQEVNRRVHSVIDRIAEEDAPERFERMGAEIFQTSPRFVSPHELTLDGGKRISAPRLILSVGSGPREAPLPGLETFEVGKDYITNLEIFDLKRRPDSLVVIGAGPIGVEMSQAFRRLGSKVTLIDIASHILIKDDADMTAIVENRLEREGVNLLLNATIVRVEKRGAIKRVILKTDDGERVVEGDQLLVSAGRRANIDGLDLDKAGISVERSFITVDSKLRTSQKHILAIGDCNGRFLFTHVASAEAFVAVRRHALRAGGSMNYRRVPWVTYTDPEIGSIGYNEQMAKKAGIHYEVITGSLEVLDRALAEGEPEGKVKMLIDRKQRLIGMQIVALHAGDLLLAGLFAVGERWPVAQLGQLIYPYPTLGEVHKKTVGAFRAPKLFNNRVRGMLRFLHGYRGVQKQ